MASRRRNRTKRHGRAPAEKAIRRKVPGATRSEVEKTYRKLLRRA